MHGGGAYPPPSDMDPALHGPGPMGGPGGPCGGPPTSIQAQLEWQKMQQQFMQEKNKPGMMGPGMQKRFNFTMIFLRGMNTIIVFSLKVALV